LAGSDPPCGLENMWHEKVSAVTALQQTNSLC
jgi:hypothetical protein